MLENEVFINGYEPYYYYVAPCQIPKSFKLGLRQIGGRIPGGGPRLRVQWGMDLRKPLGGKQVPKIVMSSRPRRVEKVLASGLVDVTIELQHFGVPMFVIEEWHSPESFVPEGSQIDAERDWEAYRFENFYERWGEPLKPPKTPFDYLFALNKIGIQPNNEERAVIFQAYEQGQIDRLPLIPTREKVLLDKPVDKVGAFPRAGRYEPMCLIRPAGAHPTEQWLDVIRESYQRRQNRQFASVEEEVADMVAKDQAARDKMRENVWDEIEHDMLLHGHRLPFSPTYTKTPNKGGSGSRVFLSPSKE